jgi:hypothetical protein
MFSIVINQEELIGLQQALYEFPSQIEEALVEAMDEAEDVVQGNVSEYAPPPDYPINWSSAKQRAAFFASNGFGGGIPHQRNGAFPDSWDKIAITATPGLIRGGVYSIEDWVKWVVDPVHQSSIHEGRWPTLPETTEEVRPEVVRVFQDTVSRAVASFRVE